MNVTIERKDHTIATISGRIDTLTSTELEHKVLPLITKGKPTIEFNCENVDYISSSGLRVFILADKASQPNGGTVIISGLNPDLKEVFDITGLTELFEFR